MVEPSTGTPKAGLKRALDFIAANEIGNISLQVLAGVARVSPHHLSALFSAKTGLTPHRYILRDRIERAKVYLQDETRSIREISKLTGFQAQGHFSKVFRTLVGSSPSQFRAACLDEVQRGHPDEALRDESAHDIYLGKR
ncbi:MAG: helix-turn-helix transcriptional regulator [Verrucomicrobia bacterium]|nr:helix-turn-helix transcriptional regulator [Verrucomicrobiota bacterium]